MTLFTEGDRVEFTHFDSWQGEDIEVGTQGKFLRYGWVPNGSGGGLPVVLLDNGTEVLTWSDYLKPVEEPQNKFYAGRKVRIVADTVHHGFPLGEEVYILGKDDAYDSAWLASKDRDAAPRWTGRAFVNDDSSVVMNVAESDMEPIEEPLADWEKELLAPGSTDLSTEQEPEAYWADVVEGSVVTIKYLPTGEEITTTAHAGEFSDLLVLGWAFDEGEDADFSDVELLRATHPKPVLPTTNGSIIRRARGYDRPEAHLIAGSWTMVGTGHNNVSPDTWVDGWVLVRDAGSDD